MKAGWPCLVRAKPSSTGKAICVMKSQSMLNFFDGGHSYLAIQLHMIKPLNYNAS